MNKIDVQLNGKWLSEEVPGFTVLSIEGRELLEKDLQTESIKGVDGATFIGSKYPTRTLKIGFFIRALTNEQRGERYNKLASLLSADEQKIIFSDESDKYFIGSVTKSGAKEIQFFCSDPFKYSTTEKSFDLRTDKTFLIKNNGTIPVPIRYEISFPSDCGYLGLAAAQGAIELGDREEADRAVTSGDERLVEWSSFLTAGYDRTNEDRNVSPGDFRKYRYPHNMKKVTVKGGGEGAIQRDYLELDTSQGSHEGEWICGSKKVITIPADSHGDVGALNWTSYFFNWFETGQMGQTGEQSIGFYDQNDEPIAVFGLWKTDTAGNSVNVTFTTKHGTVGHFMTSGGWWEPYGSGNRGHGRISKRDDWVEFYYNGGSYRYHDPDLKTRKACKIKIAIADNLCNSKPVSINRIADVDFTKFGVIGSTDVINTFSSTSKLTVDGVTGRSYINGQHRPDLEILGSRYFKAQPGDTEVKVVPSSWFTGTLTGKAYIREVWL